MNDMSPHPTRDREAGTGPIERAERISDILMEQAYSLDAMFAELARDAAKSRPFVDSTAAYTRLALRAQGNCRAALEAVSRADRAALRMGVAGK